MGSQRIEITGQRFGRLIVVRYFGHSKWVCKCDCGNTRLAKGTDLRAGKIQSCGCLRRDGRNRSNFRDLTDMEYADLHVKQYLGSGKWLCLCKCGNDCIVAANDLIDGRVISCGCRKKEKKAPKPIKNLSGRKFGKLTAVEYVGDSTWLCLCDCGNTTRVKTSRLMSGNTSSCGCLKRESLSAIATVHGGSGTRLYKIWQNMKGRCLNPNDKSYRFYGARGIKICDEWLESFDAFRTWAIENGYSDSLTIDRIDVNGNYCPNNCRWATWDVQYANRRPTAYVGPKKAVEQIDEYGNVIASFNSEVEAGRAVGVSPSRISSVVNGHIESINGTYWRFAQGGIDGKSEPQDGNDTSY